MKQPTVESFIQPGRLERAGNFVARLIDFLGLCAILGAGTLAYCFFTWNWP